MQGVDNLSSSRNDRLVKRNGSNMDIKCFKLFWCFAFVPTPFPTSLFWWSRSSFLWGLVINVTWPRKRQEKSKFIRFTKEYLLQRLGRSYLAFWVSSCPNNIDDSRNDLFFSLIEEVHKQTINCKCLNAFDKTSFINFITSQELMIARRNRDLLACM